MTTDERAQVVIDRAMDFKQSSGFTLKQTIIEVIKSAQFAAVEECVSEVYNTKTTPKDTFMKYRNKIIKNINTVKGREV